MPHEPDLRSQGAGSFNPLGGSQKHAGAVPRRKADARTEGIRLGLSQLEISQSDQKTASRSGNGARKPPAELGNMSPFPRIPLVPKYTTKDERSKMRGNAAKTAKAYLQPNARHRSAEKPEKTVRDMYAPAVMPGCKDVLREEIKAAKNSMDMAIAELDCLRRGRPLNSTYPGLTQATIVRHLNTIVAREKGILETSESRYRAHPEVLAAGGDSVSTSSSDMDRSGAQSTASSRWELGSSNSQPKGRGGEIGVIRGSDNRVVGYQSD